MSPKHKRFLTLAGSCAGVVLLAFLAGVLPLSSSADSARVSADKLRRTVETRMGSDEFHGEADLARARAELDQLDGGLSTLAEAIALPDSADFMVKDGDSDRLIVYKSAVESVKRALRKLAADRDIPMPESFGFPEGDVPADKVNGLLRRLQVLDRALRAALDSGVAAVLAVGPAEEKDRDEEADDAVLRRASVHLEVQARFETVLRLIHALQQKGNFLAIIRLAIDCAEPETDVVKVRFVLAGLRARLDVPVAESEAAEKPEKPAGGGEGGKKPGTWRPGR